MTIEYFLNLLENVKQTRCGWQARCPAHADRSPSLTIQDGEEGRILVQSELLASYGEPARISWMEC